MERKSLQQIPKALFASLMLVFLGVSVFSATEAEIISKLKEIDNSMRQGTISYTSKRGELVSVKTKDTLKNNAKRSEKDWRPEMPRPAQINTAETLIFDDKSNTKYNTTFEVFKDGKKIQSRKIISFSDGKNSYRTIVFNKSIYEKSDNTDKNTLDIFEYQKSNIYERPIFVQMISNKPDFIYGRGLSGLKGLKINPNTNIATGYFEFYVHDNPFSPDKKTLERMDVTALLDPKLDYAAYKIEISDFRLKVTRNIENSIPILVDGKYYIYSESVTYPGSSGKNKCKVKILAATFKKPNDKNYIFNLADNKQDIRDYRKDHIPVFYKRADLPKDINPDKLLKMTERRVVWEKTKIFSKNVYDASKKYVMDFINIFDSAGLIRILAAILIISALIIFFKKKKELCVEVKF